MLPSELLYCTSPEAPFSSPLEPKPPELVIYVSVNHAPEMVQ